MNEPRSKLLIIGTGFAAFSLIKEIDVDRYQVTIVSPRNHFLFTPLLPSTTVGTVEFRSIMEPIRTARKGIRFHQGFCVRIDAEQSVAYCEGKFKRTPFEVEYDTLIIAVGAKSNTFGIPGVEQHANFLKEISDAHQIRHQIIQCFERASKPGRPVQDFDWLLHFVVVGGGPTGVEFAAEMNDFLRQDLSKWFPELMPYVKITLLEAQEDILSAFDISLSSYTTRHFARQHIRVRTNAAVKKVQANAVILENDEEIPFGLLVWSTGNGPTNVVANAGLSLDSGRLVVDEKFLVLNSENIYAVGDCAIIEGNPLPPTAQVAQQQGAHLAKVLNKALDGVASVPFKYKHRGMMAYVGQRKALVDTKNVQGKGFGTWLFWRSAYLTKLMSWKNKMLVVVDWIRTFIFGRDISQF
ncbi:MAG: FAD-dependent oxidoreductase [Candidatus Hydrogenedentota bacterium]